MDAFASVISNNLNVVMKYLTAITIILMLPALVASFYGMNVSLPLEKSPYAFLFTIGISLNPFHYRRYYFYKKKMVLIRDIIMDTAGSTPVRTMHPESVTRQIIRKINRRVP